MAFKFIRGYLTGIINRGKGGGERGQFTGKNWACNIITNIQRSTKKCYWTPRGVWLCLLFSHFSWEASNMKTFKTNGWIIIVTYYRTRPAKLFWVCDHFGRQARNFFDTSQQPWRFKTYNYKIVFEVISVIMVKIMKKQKV